MRRRLLLILAILALIAGGLVLLSYSPLRDITTAPARGGSPAVQFEPQDSIISLPVRLRYTDLAQYANQKIPEVLVNERKMKRYKTRILGISTTIKGRLETFVKRMGPVEVGRHENELELNVPLRFEAEFTSSKTLLPDAETRGAVNVRLRLTPGMTPDWQPTLKARSSYQWLRKPRLEIGFLNLDGRDMLGDALEKRLDKLTRELEEDVRESAGLRERAAEYWYELHQVRQLGEDDLPAWLMVDPQAAYFTPVRMTDEAMVLEFALAARLTTLLGNVQPPPEAEPLPALNISAPPQRGLHLNLPVLLHYAGIRDALRQRYLGQSFELARGELTVEDIRFYASGELLVLGVKISARAPTRLFNTRGWLYLQGRPVVDMQQQQLRLEDFDFTRQVDNPLVSSASWVLQDSLRGQLAEALTLDLAEPIAKARETVRERMNRPLGEGFVMSGGLDKLGVSHIQPRDRDLLLLLDTTGHVAIETELAAGQISPEPEQAAAQ